MIYTVTFNPSIDYIVTADDFQTGRINRTTSELILPGGKGINVSFVLKALGEETTALGFTAGFVGEEIRRLVKKAGIREDFIDLCDGVSRINVKLISIKDTELNGRGPVIEKEALNAFFEKLSMLKEGDALILSGSVPDGMSKDLYGVILETLKGKKVLTAVDASGELLRKAVENTPFVVKPNEHELGELFGVTIETKEDAVFYGKKLQEMGAENVLVSMGGKGAVLLTADGRVFTANAPEGKLVSTVGAGDSMLAGFVSGYRKTGDYAEAFRTSLATGSATAFSDHLAGCDEIRDVLKRTAVEEIT